MLEQQRLGKLLADLVRPVALPPGAGLSRDIRQRAADSEVMLSLQAVLQTQLLAVRPAAEVRLRADARTRRAQPLFVLYTSASVSCVAAAIACSTGCCGV